MKLSFYNNLPNLISLARLMLSPLILLVPDPLVPYFFFLLALSDALDGLLARRLKLQTELGKILDPLADKTMMFFGLLVCVFKLKTLPKLLFFLVILRDVYILTGASLLIFIGKDIPQARPFGKAFTFSLSLLIVLCMLNISFPWLLWFVLFLLFASWLDYTIIAIKKLKNQTSS